MMTRVGMLGLVFALGPAGATTVSARPQRRWQVLTRPRLSPLRLPPARPTSWPRARRSRGRVAAEVRHL